MAQKVADSVPRHQAGVRAFSFTICVVRREHSAVSRFAVYIVLETRSGWASNASSWA